MMGFTVATVLACFILVTADSARVQRDTVICGGLNSCLAPYNRYGDLTRVAALDQLNTPDALDAYCRSLEGMSDCALAQVEDGTCRAESEITHARQVVKMTSYICATENRATYLNIANMKNSCLRTLDKPWEPQEGPCADTFRTDIKSLVESSDFSAGVGDACPLYHELGACIVRELSTLCEPQIVSLLDQLLIQYIDPLAVMQFGCSPSTTYTV